MQTQTTALAATATAAQPAATRKQPKVIVAFFAGTGWNINPRDPSYVNYETLMNGEKEKNPPTNPGTDDGFELLTTLLKRNEEEQMTFSYDGCSRRGGGIFANQGVDEPADHLIKYLYQCMDPKSAEKTTLLLTGHSRGCATAAILAQKITKQRFADRVEIILDLRDLVPGNLPETHWFDTASAKGKTTLASRCQNLTECKQLKSVYLTVQERGQIGTAYHAKVVDSAYDVLVPKLPENTPFYINPLVGDHNIQQNDFPTTRYHETGCYELNINIFYLGAYHSLQIYFENKAQLIDNWQDVLIEKHQKVVKNLTEEKPYAKNNIPDIVLHEALIKNLADAKNDPIKCFKTAKFLIYERILQDYREHPERTPLKKDFLVKGQCKSKNKAATAHYFNEEHYELAITLGKPNKEKVLFYVVTDIRSRLVTGGAGPSATPVITTNTAAAATDKKDVKTPTSSAAPFGMFAAATTADSKADDKSGAIKSRECCQALAFEFKDFSKHPLTENILEELSNYWQKQHGTSDIDLPPSKKKDFFTAITRLTIDALNIRKQYEALWIKDGETSNQALQYFEAVLKKYVYDESAAYVFNAWEALPIRDMIATAQTTFYTAIETAKNQAGPKLKNLFEEFLKKHPKPKPAEPTAAATTPTPF